MVTEVDAAVKIQEHQIARADEFLIRADGEDVPVLGDLLRVGGYDEAGRGLLNTGAKVNDDAVSGGNEVLNFFKSE